jgi:demethylmenaquinone methyltransferase/2-methoxy-6-polyprenyl-1,4-benzoquinol methylase
MEKYGVEGVTYFSGQSPRYPGEVNDKARTTSRLLAAPALASTRMVAEYYAARALEYDLTAGYTDPVAEPLRAPAKARYQELLWNADVLEVACGAGYWTEVVAQVARSVLATDISDVMLGLARRRLAAFRSVRFTVADAYSLEGVPRGFNAAFGHWWWSHMPRRLIPQFLTTLHSRLSSGARVLFVDQLPSAYSRVNPGLDGDGNMTEERTVSNGRRFRIVKNFPSREEVLAAVAARATDVEYREFPDECSWSVSYRVAG